MEILGIISIWLGLLFLFFKAKDKDLTRYDSKIEDNFNNYFLKKD